MIRSTMKLLLGAMSVLLVLSLAPSLASAEGEGEKKVDEGTETSAWQEGDPSKYKENIDSIPYLVAAYAVIWAGLFLYLYSLQKRQSVVDADIAELREQLKRWDEKQDASP